MNTIYEIIVTGIISTISALIVFYLSEKTKSISQDRIGLKKLSLELFEMIIMLNRFESSCKQFIKINSDELAENGSVGFPRYVFHNFKDNIPNIFYYNNNDDLYADFIKLNRICFILNALMQDLDIKNDLLTKQISIKESKKEYKFEQDILENTLSQIPKYISLVKRLYATIWIINNYKSIFNFIYLKTNFKEEKIKNEIKRIDNEIKNSFRKIEEFQTQ